MTLRYAHVGDRETEAAAERIGAAIARALDGSEAIEGAPMKLGAKRPCGVTNKMRGFGEEDD